jgi:hypothetical protein
LSRRTINESLKRSSKDNLSCFIINLNWVFSIYK